MLPRRIALSAPLILSSRLSSRLASRPSTPLIRSKSMSPFPQPPPPENEQASETPAPTRGLILPAPPGDNDREGVITLDVSGEGTTVKLDALGPLVIGRDGSMSRVANWAEMADIEKETTLRVLGKRNKARLEALRKPESQSDHTGDGSKGGNS